MTITLTRPETYRAGNTATDVQVENVPIKNVQATDVSTDVVADVQLSRSEQSGEIKQQTLALLHDYQTTGLPYLKDRIVRLNLGLARREAHYWANQCQENYEDLLQVGSIGLVSAIDRFDLTKGYAFSTFALPYIRGEIQHYLRDKSSVVRVPRRWLEMLQKSASINQKFQAEHQRFPTDTEMATALDVSVAEWQEVQLAKQNRQAISLDCPTGDDEGHCMMDILPDHGYRSFQLADEDRQRLRQGLVTLEQHTRQIIEFIFFYDLTQKEVAEKMNISVITVSRHVKKGVGSLKSFFQENN
jgi:RNA polymerase sigma-B factor